MSSDAILSLWELNNTEPGDPLPVLAALAPAVNEIQLKESHAKLHAVLSHTEKSE